MKSHFAKMGLFVAVMVLVQVFCLGAPVAQAEDTVEIGGSTTVAPIAEAFRDYWKAVRKPVIINISATGSGDGAKGIVDGSLDIGNMSRFMKDKEFKTAVDAGIHPVAHVVALDGIAIVVHPSNPVEGLKLDQVAAMFKGEIKNWSEVGGPNMPIVLIGREHNSGTYDTFEGLVMSKQDQASSVAALNSNGAVRARIQNTQGAVGYLGLGFVDDSVKALKIDGVMPSEATVKAGQYAVARPLFMFTNGYPELGSAVQQFVTFHLTETGQQIIREIGYVPVTEY